MNDLKIQIYPHASRLTNNCDQNDKCTKSHLAMFIRPVADEGASRRILALVVVVPALLSFLFNLLSQYLFTCFNRPEFFVADFALVAINTLLVPLRWLRYNLGTI